MATASTVTFGGLALAGADASNYDLMLHSPASATITAANPVPTVVLNASSIPIAAPLILMMPTMNLAPPPFSVEAAMPSAPPAPLPAPAPGPANAAASVTNATEAGPINPVSVNGSDNTTAAPAQSPAATVNDTSAATTTPESATHTPAAAEKSSSHTAQDQQPESSARPVLTTTSQQLSPSTTLTILGGGIKLPEKSASAKK